MNTKPILSLAVILMSFSLMGMTQEKRQVTVNGVSVTITEIQGMDRLYCGPVPDAQFWVSDHTGRWEEREKAPAQNDISQSGAKKLEEPEEGLSTDQSWMTTSDWCHKCEQRLP